MSADPILVRAPNPGVFTLTGTNTWVIPGPDGTIVVDPGPDDPRHVAAVRAHGPVLAVLLTHRHADHSAALPRFPADVPVYTAAPAFARGADPVRDGETLRITGREVRVIGTPGHTADSVCFALPGPRPVVFTGDTLLGGRNSTLLADGDGDLPEYFASLARLEALAGWAGAPGHGPRTDDVAGHAASARAHRERRLAQLAELLASGQDPDPVAIARSRYPGEPSRWAAAARMVAAELATLGSRAAPAPDDG